MANLRESDPVVVAKFLDVPVSLVAEQLDSMSDHLYVYLNELFEKYTDHGE